MAAKKSKMMMKPKMKGKAKKAVAIAMDKMPGKGNAMLKKRLMDRPL